jgi:hypothetical protein
MQALRRRGYSSHSSMTLALKWGEWSASHPGHALLLGKGPQYPLDRRLGGPQSWSGHKRLEEKPVPGIEPQSVVRRYTD